ncbi:MAG: hypothetical protein ACRDRR_09575 [Pseudonocardiaceae bacterium]
MLAQSPVEAIGLDLVAGAGDLGVAASLPRLQHKTVLAGVVDGRNVWRTDPDAALSRAATLLGSAGRVEIGTSCPLLHVPSDVDVETALAPSLRDRLAFARQKIDEVVLLGRALREGRAAVSDELAAAAAGRTGGDRTGERDDRVRARLDSLGADHYRRGSPEQRGSRRSARAWRSGRCRPRRSARSRRPSRSGPTGTRTGPATSTTPSTSAACGPRSSG